MDRLKLWLLPIYAVIGFVVILAIVPTSRWIVVTQLDVLAGRWKYLNYSPDGSRQGDYLEPRQSGLDDRSPATDETARFLQLLTPPVAVADNREFVQRFKDLFEICKARNDVRYWAQFVRVASTQAQIRDETPNARSGRLPDFPEVQTRLLDACLAGERLEPQNAFFPMIESGLLSRMGNVKGSRDAFFRAAECSQYNSYVSYEPDSRWNYIQEHLPNRGRQLRAHIYMSTLFQHLGTLMSLGRHFTKKEDLDGRMATLKLGSLIMAKDPTMIGVYVARNLVAQAFDSHRRVVSSIRNDVMKQMIALYPRDPIARTTIENAVQNYQAITLHVTDVWRPDANDLVLNMRPGLSAWSLVALMMLPLALLVTQLKLKSSKFATASPYLVWLLPLSMEHAFGSAMSATTPFGIAALLFLAALSPKLTKYVDRLAIPLVIGAALLGTVYPPLLTPTALFAASVLIERRAQSLDWKFTALGIFVACVVGAGYWVNVATRVSMADGIVFGLLATSGACSAIPVKAPMKWLNCAGACCLAMGIWYGANVAIDVTMDRKLEVFCDSLLRDADRLRQGSAAQKS